MKKIIIATVLGFALVYSSAFSQAQKSEYPEYECPEGDDECEEDCGGTGCEDELIKKARQLFACNCSTDSDCSENCGGNGNPQPTEEV